MARIKRSYIDNKKVLCLFTSYDNDGVVISLNTLVFRCSNYLFKNNRYIFDNVKFN